MQKPIVRAVLICAIVALLVSAAVVSGVALFGPGQGPANRPQTPVAKVQPPKSPLIGQSITDFPDAGLVNEEGQSVSFETLPSKPVLLSFIYTRCPMPTMCPRITKKMRQVQSKMQAIQDQLRGSHAGDDSPVHFVSVTFDPAYDTPKVLKKYGKAYKIDLSSWDFWTGPPKTIKQLTEKLKIHAERTGKQTIMHNMRTYVLDQNQVVQGVYRGSGWNPGKVIRQLRKMVGGSDK